MPVADFCGARTAGTQLQRPTPRTARQIPVIDVATAVLRDAADRLLLVRRDSSLLRGMWCFPGVEIGAADAAGSVALRIARRYAQPRSEPRSLATVEHTFSHRRERYSVFLIDVEGTPGDAADTVWTRDTSNLALPRAQQRIRTLALVEMEAG